MLLVTPSIALLPERLSEVTRDTATLYEAKAASQVAKQQLLQYT